LTGREIGAVGGEVHQWVQVLGLAAEFGRLVAEIRAHIPDDRLHPVQVRRAEHLVAVVGHETK